MVDISLKEKEEGRPRMEARARPDHPSMLPDIVILVLFVVATVAGVVSIVFNSSNGLAFTQLALTLGGLFLGIVQVKHGIFGDWLGNMLKYRANVLRAITVVFLFVIIVLQTVILTGITSGTQSSIATPSHPSVLITAPMDGSQVSILTPVQGTAQNIPKDEELWLFIAPFNQTTYFPQHGPIKILDEKWSTAASFGGANDVGLKFRLIPVLSNQNDIEAHKKIAEYFHQRGPVYKDIAPTHGMKLMLPGITVVRE